MISIFKSLLGSAVGALALLPVGAAAEPITLKLSFYTSDRSASYLGAVKPFVDAVNREGKGLVQIEVYFSGALAKVQREQPQLVLDGVADIAFIVPGQNPERFPDTAAIELPGLFRDQREASLVYTRLVAADAFAGYQDFFVIGAYASELQAIHSRKRLVSLADLKGQKIRTNNLTESAALSKFGAVPVVLAFNETSQAIGSGLIDGATAPPARLFDVGIGRLVSNHYLLLISTAPLTLMMSRKAFDRLPEQARNLIRKFSGEWAVSRYSGAVEADNKEILEHLKSDPRRKVVYPSPSDLDTARQVFKSIADDWTADSARNSELLQLVDAEIAKIHSAQ